MSLRNELKDAFAFLKQGNCIAAEKLLRETMPNDFRGIVLDHRKIYNIHFKNEIVPDGEGIASKVILYSPLDDAYKQI